MKGFMRRRGDAWELRVYLGTDPVTGKQRYATRTVRGGKREAQRALNEMVTDAERGLSVRTNATAGELIEAWFEHAAGDFSPKTVKETRGFIDRNLLPAIGAVPLSKLKPSDLDRLYRRLQATGAVGEGGLAPATVRRIHGILRRALAQGVKWGWLGVNPAAATTPPRVPQTEIAPPSGPDLARVLRRAWESSPELACYLVLAAATGARRSELVALRWRDLDLSDGTVRIERGVVMGPAGLVEKDTKTHAARRVALDDGTVADRRRSPSPDDGDGRRCVAPSSPTTRSCSAMPATAPSRGSRTRCREASSGSASPRDSPTRGSTTSATSWPANCWAPGSTYAPSPAGSVTATPQRRSTCTPTSSSRRTAARRTSSAG